MSTRRAAIVSLLALVACGSSATIQRGDAGSSASDAAASVAPSDSLPTMPSSSDVTTEGTTSPPTTTLIPAPPISPPGTPGSARVSGIEATRQGPFFGGEFSVTTRYAGPFGFATWIEVYAGSTHDSLGLPLHAALRIYLAPLDEAATTPWRYVGDFVVPGQATSAELLSIKGATLLVALDGRATVVFDLATHEFR